MGKRGFITLRGDAQPQNEDLPADKFTLGDVELDRVTFQEPGGTLQQEISLSYKGDVISGAVWVFMPDGSSDQHLDALDHHWQSLQWHLRIRMEEANFYNHIKNPNTESENNPLLALFFHDLGDELLRQPVPDNVFAKGKTKDLQFNPLTQDHEFGTAIRNAASQEPGMEMDPFELSLMALDHRMYEAEGAYNKARMEEFEDEKEELQATAGEGDNEGRQDEGGHGDEKGLQAVGGEDYDGDEDDDNPEAWRGDQHPDEDGEDENAAWRGDQHREQSPEQERELWHSGDEGGQDAAAAEKKDVDTLMREYHEFIDSFSNAANRVWMAAAEQIYKNRQVSQEAYIQPLYSMKAFKAQAERVYEQLKEAADEEAMGAENRMQPVFDLLEDKQKGVFTRMGRLVDMASNPARFEAMVKKHMNKQRAEENERGM